MTSYAHAIVQTTTDTSAEADKLASAAIERQLAACVQVSQVQSYYRWQGQTQQDTEFLLSFKTSTTAVAGLKEYLSAYHSYDEPEIIVVPITDGSPGYLQWISDATY